MPQREVIRSLNNPSLMPIKNASLLLFLSIFTTVVSGQVTADSTTQREPLIRKSSWLALPILFYTPETRLGGGGATLYTFRFRGEPETSNPSQLQLGVAYTQEQQILSYLPFQLYFQQEKWWLVGELGYYRYIYRFFGIGNNTPQEEEIYQANYPRLRLDVLRQVKPQLYLGLRYWFDNYQIVERDSAGRLVEQIITGQNGGVVSGLGLVLNRDSRDRIFFPSRGNLIQFTLFTNQKALGSDFNYSRITVDASQYFHFGKEKILAVNGVLDFLFGDPPFQQLALIGGPKKLRGFFEGRFRDKKLWILQTEYRMPVYRFIGIVAFAGVGSVAPNVGNFFSQSIHFAGGVGLRFRVSQKDKINIRLDLGVNEEGRAFPYLTVGEAF